MSDFDEPYLNVLQLLSWVHLRDRKLIRVADHAADGKLKIELYANHAVLEGGIKAFEKIDDAPRISC